MFQKLDNGINSLAPSFGNDCVKCHRLIIAMCQNDHVFIDILKRFRIETNNTANINTINSLCHKQPPNGSTFLYLFI